MVDATASFESKGLAAISAIRDSGLLPVLDASVGSADALAAYAAFCEAALFAPAQSASWARNWTAHTRPDMLVATLRADGRPVLALALEVTRKGPFRIARFMGGRHANGNFAAADRAWATQADAGSLKPLFEAIARSRPDIDLVALERLLPDLDGVANPLAALAGSPSPNLSLAVDLDGGFDAVLSRTSAKRKRKKHRSQIRKFETAGPWRRLEAATPEEVDRLLQAFFAMKEARFRKMGIANVFGEAEVQAFFRAIFGDALAEKTPPFVLHGLEVAGKLRAVTGSSVCGHRLICEFGSIADDELGHASPGDFLFFENIQEACQRGFAVYDFSVGDEPYKRLWCDIETRHVDVLVPLSAKGRALALSMRQGARLISFVKTNPILWKITKRLRRKAAGKQAAAQEDGD